MKDIFEIKYIKDPKQGGYTAFFKDFQDIVVEGKTKKEARENLYNALYDVLKYLFKNHKTSAAFYNKI